ncbi:MAG TPA: ATP-grasp domain-containing protein [Tissierellia bacterium]|nr:ATP-grasp domain-containing protein [Tissierellia bacterium]
MNILFTAIGKRVQLIKYFKNEHYVVGVDSGNLAPATYFVDEFYKVPRCDEKNYVNCLIDICKKEKVDMIVPLYEKEFLKLCDSRKLFEEIGTVLLLSHKKIIEICNDKLESYKFFIENDIKTPFTYDMKSIKKKEVSFPLIIKPRDGMGSKGVFIVKNEKELNFFIDYVKNPIVQEFVEGTEYTIDVLCDLKGKVISVVPRERIEVRSGEVSKSKIVKNSNIINATLDLCNKLNIDSDIKPVGPLTIQCIVNKSDDIKFIEVNPRFGGGVPLTFEAGVSYQKYFEKMVNGEDILSIINDFKEITMLRFDDAVFI